MPYVEDRLVHDADSHLMEMSDCLNPYFEKNLLRRFLAHPNLGVRVGNRLAIEDAQKRHSRFFSKYGFKQSDLSMR